MTARAPPRRTTRVELPSGWRYEIMSLTFQRARIIATDGVMNVGDFW